MPPITKYLLSIVTLAFFLGSCDEPNNVISTQDIGNAAWRNNTSLLAFAEKRNFVSVGAFIYKLYETGEDGSLRSAISDEETDESVPFISVSSDGNTAIALLDSKLFRLDLRNGSKTQLTTNVTKVFTVSPEQKYVLLTHAELFNHTKTVSLLDISGPAARSVKEWQVRGLLVSQGFWLKDDRIALNIDTASQPFVSIYDTNGVELQKFLNLQTPARSSAYVPGSNLLYGKTFNSLEQVNLETGERTNIADNYVNLDARENTLAYIQAEDGKNKIFIRNIASGETSEVANDAFRFAILSPDASKLAYLVETREFFTELKVINVTTP